MALPITWLAVIILFSILRPALFPTAANAASILSSQAVLVALTLGVLAPLTVGDLDVSAAAVVGLSAMMLVILTANLHINVVLAVVLTIACASLVGLLNGVCSALLGLDTLIVTLATGSLVAGITAWISNNNTITGLPQVLVQVVVADHFLGVSLEFFYGLALCLVVFYLLRYTPLGRRMLIVGQARDVAWLSGINVRRVRMGSLVFSATFAGLAGVLYAGTSGSAPPAGGAGAPAARLRGRVPGSNDDHAGPLQSIRLAHRRLLPGDRNHRPAAAGSTELRSANLLRRGLADRGDRVDSG